MTLPEAKFKLKMDDGIIDAWTRETVFCSLFWLFQKVYPQVPILKAHHLNGQRLTKHTHPRLLTRLIRDSYDLVFAKHTKHYAATHQVPVLEPVVEERDAIYKLCALTYEVTIKIHNFVSTKLGAWVVGISALDYLQVVDHPEIKAANAVSEPNQKNVLHSHKVVGHVIDTSKDFVGNRLAETNRTKSVSAGQNAQNVAARGYVTDPDSTIRKVPIMGGFAQGMANVYESVVEFQSTKKSLEYNKDPIKELEYFNRQTQLQCMVILDIEFGDCGTTRTNEFEVTAKSLKSLDGRYHVLDDGRLENITPESRHLIGKTIKLRSPQQCHALIRQNLCSVCYGDQALSIMLQQNVGNVSSASMGGAATQGLLQTKHEDGSAITDEIILDEVVEEYLAVSPLDNRMRFTSKLMSGKWKLSFYASEAINLPDINHVDNTEKLSTQNISSLSEIILINTTDEGEEHIPMTIAHAGRNGSFTHNFIRFIRTVNYHYVEDGRVEVDLDGWDLDLDVLEFPMRSYNMIEHVRNLKKFIFRPKVRSLREYKARGLDDIMKERTQEFFDIVDKRMDLPLIHMEVILASTLEHEDSSSDRRLPSPEAPRVYGDMGDQLTKRSMATAMIYENQNKTLTNPGSYLKTPRPYSPFDDVLFPFDE